MTVILSLKTLLAVVSFAQYTIAWSGCPKPEDMLPCTCARPKGYTNVTCKGSLKEINDGIKILSARWMGVDELNLISSEIKVLGKRHFGMADVHILKLFTPNLRTIDPEAFRTMERDFYELIIFKSSIAMLSDVIPSLKEVFRLRLLQINNSPRIEDIPNDAFTGAFENNALLILNLNDNAIKSVGDDAFSSLLVLRYLYLESNKIKFISPTAIRPPNSYIREIHLE